MGAPKGKVPAAASAGDCTPSAAAHPSCTARRPPRPVQLVLELFGSPFLQNCEVVIALLFGFFLSAVCTYDGKKASWLGWRPCMLGRKR